MAVEAIARALRWFLEGNRRASPSFRLAEREGGKRARELLFAQLTAAQRAEVERWHGFTVRGQSGRLYRIGFGSVANIEALDEHGNAEYRLCACPRRLPAWGVMLAQKLMLESREAEFLRVAIRHPADLMLTRDLGAQPRQELRPIALEVADQ